MDVESLQRWQPQWHCGTAATDRLRVGEEKNKDV